MQCHEKRLTPRRRARRNGAMLEPVRIRRPALVSGLLIAAFVVALFCVRTVPNTVIAWFGGPSSTIERVGGLRVRFQPLPGAWPAYEERSGDLYIRRDGDELVIELLRVTPEAAPVTLDMLVSGGATLHEVRDSSLAAFGGDAVAYDVWNDERGARHEQTFLRAPSREALEEVVAATQARGWKLPAETEIGYERVEQSSESGDLSHWRTYELATDVVIDGSMIVRASASFDPTSNRPVVLADLTAAGADRFCAATERLVGRKIAMVLGGRVRSAPIINGAICDGRILITMGGGDASAAEREAVSTASIMPAGALAKGGRVVGHEFVPPAEVRAEEWAGRLLLGLIAGIAFGGCVLFVLRWMAPRRSTSERAAPSGRFPWRRLAVTLLGPIAVFAGGKIALPGVDVEQFTFLGSTADARNVSLVSLGIAPILSSFILVEIVALAIPRLRWRRHDPSGRAGLGKAVAVLAVVIVAVQAYFAAQYLEMISFKGVEVVIAPGWQFRGLMIASLVTATLLLAVLAGMIREHGLGNGYGVLFAAAALIEARPKIGLSDLVEHRREVLAFLIANPGYLLGGITATAIAISTVFVLRLRIAVRDREPALRVPTSGVAPGQGIMLVLLAAFAIAHGWQALFVQPLHEANRGWQLAIVAAAAPIWAWIFARPALIAGMAEDAGLDAPTRASWLRAAVLSALLLAGAHAMWLLAGTASAQGWWPADPISVMICTAVVLDVVADARAHRGKLVPIAALHQIQRAAVIERVLADAGIPCHIHASQLRTLLAFFGPWAPAIVLVPEELAATARAKIEAATHPALSAFA